MALTNDEESETEHNSKKLISPPQSKNGLKRTLNFRAQPRLRKRENDIVHGKTKGRSRKDEFCVVDEAAELEHALNHNCTRSKRTLNRWIRKFGHVLHVLSPSKPEVL